MATKRIESILMKGYVNKGLRMSYVYNLELDSKYNTIVETDEGNIKIYPAYMICISEPYPGPRVFISSMKYFTFVVLLEKSVKLIQENLFELFPNVGKVEFDMDDSALERFQKEKALSSADITIIPVVYTDSTSTCSPGLRISIENKDSSIVIPLEDAIAMNRLFSTFDPNIYGLSILSKLINIE